MKAVLPFIILFILLPGILIAGEKATLLETGQKKYSPRCEILVDKGGKLTFEDARESSGFRKSAANSFGFTPDRIWVRFKYRIPEEATEKWYLEISYPQLDCIDLWQIKGKKISHRRAGDSLPFDKRDIRHHNFILALDNTPGLHTCYLRVATESSMTIPVSLVTHKYIIEELNIQKTLFGIFYGILIIMILYNLLLSISMKDITYIWYVVFILSMMLVSLALNGYGFQYIWPGAVWLNKVAPFSVFMVLVSMTIFSFLFLEIHEKYPKVEIIFKMIVVFSLGGLVLSWVLPYRIMMMLSAASLLPPIVLIIFIAVVGVKRGNRQAFFYIIAFFSLFAGSVVTIFHRFGIFSASSFTLWGFQIGCSLTIALLSLGLADRVNRLKNNLALLNVNLEDRVIDRTKSLKEANDMIRRDMKIASAVQANMLPQEIPSSGLYDVAYIYEPVSEVSGDFFDFYSDSHGLAGVGLFDVSGHGISSGLLTLMARSIITRNFHDNQQKPLGNIMENINHELVQEMQNVDHYITGVLLRFREERIDYVNSGHPDIIYHNCSSGKTGKIVDREGKSISGPFLGLEIMKGDYRNISFRIEKGDCLFLYSDCFIESVNERGEHFDIKRLMETLCEIPESDAETVLSRIMEKFYDYVGGSDKLTDDLTAMVVRRM